MGWSNYIYFKKEKVAFEIGKTSMDNIYEDVRAKFEEFADYMTEKEDSEGNDPRKFEVVKYLWDRCFIFGSLDVMNSVIAMLLDFYSEKDTEIISEEELDTLQNKHKDLKIVSRW